MAMRRQEAKERSSSNAQLLEQVGFSNSVQLYSTLLF
jgi:hypothetical protein